MQCAWLCEKKCLRQGQSHDKRAHEVLQRRGAVPLKGLPFLGKLYLYSRFEGLGGELRLKQKQAAQKSMNEGADCFSEDGLVALSA